MSNSMRVVFSNMDYTRFSPVVYLHWNGGQESLTAFLGLLEKAGWHDESYAAARFTQIVSNFFDEMGKDPSPRGIGLEGWSETLRGIKGITESDNGTFLVTYAANRTIKVSRYTNGERVYKVSLKDLYEMLPESQKKKCDKIYTEYEKWWF